MKLVLCAGDRHIPGFTHHDIQGKQDILCDLFDIQDKVPNASCEEIHFTHALEHFPASETQRILGIVMSLLTPRGKLYIEVPNFAWNVSLLAEGRDRDAIYYAFGGQLDEYDLHKTGFTASILRDELVKAGFADIKVEDQSSLVATCIRP